MEKDSRIQAALSKRYVDAYRHAEATVGAGSVIKFFAVTLGLTIAFGGLVAKVGMMVFIGLVTGLGTGVGLFMIGVGIAAQGQLLMAATDTAINTSPFLDDEEKATAMRLLAHNKPAANPIEGPNSDVGKTGGSHPLRCTVCNRTRPSRHYFLGEGKTPRLVCQDCVCKLPKAEVARLLEGVPS